MAKKLTKKEIMDKLDELGIAYDPNANKADLESLLEEAPKEQVEEEQEEKPRPTPRGCKWMKVNKEELAKLQKDGELVGWDPKTKEALVEG